MENMTPADGAVTWLLYNNTPTNFSLFFVKGLGLNNLNCMNHRHTIQLPKL